MFMLKCTAVGFSSPSSSSIFGFTNIYNDIFLIFGFNFKTLCGETNRNN